MAGSWTDYRVFWGQFRQNYHTTGAIAPSGPVTGLCLVSLCQRRACPPSRSQPVAAFSKSGPARGPSPCGVGSSYSAQAGFARPGRTERLVSSSISASVFQREPAFQAVANPVPACSISRSKRCRPTAPLRSDHLGLAAEQLQRGLGRGNPDQLPPPALRPGGTLSFFEYIAIRRARNVDQPRHSRAGSDCKESAEHWANCLPKAGSLAIGSGPIFPRPGSTTFAPSQPPRVQPLE